MNNFLFHADTWLLLIGFIVIFRQLRVVLTAEQGRKHDLAKKLYRANLGFNLSVLIPFLDTQKYDALFSLLQALQEQDYPTKKVAINIVASHQTVGELHPRNLPANVKIWTFPAFRANVGEALSWLIQRCLASPGTGLFIFLNPDDMVKRDFFQNVATRGMDSSVIQGYVALKSWPKTILGKVTALSERLMNRVWNAGCYHLGMSSRLLDSGWVVQREILEMIPYRRGNDIDNFEYTIRLNLGGFRVTWAPQITIYSNEKSDFIGYLTLCLASIMNRVQMFINYSHLLVTRALLKANFNALEQIASTLKPPHFVFGFILAYLTYLAHMGHSSIPGNETTWFTLTLAYVGLQLFSLFVARARGSDYLTFFVWTPTVYVMSVLALPWALITSMISFGIQTRNSYEEKARSRQVMGNRFIETLEEEENNGPERYERIIQEVIEKRAPEKQVLKEKNYATQPSKPQLKETAPGQEAASHSSSHLEETKLVPLSNGEKQVQCQLKTITQCHPNGSQTYQMILQYKSVAFSTAPYHLQDQAFYELQSKLMNRGFTIVACGSCGNFYNASPQSSEQPSGVCLYGKLGKQIHPEEDGVTVLTEACPHYCGIEERESIVRQWRQSIITLLK